MRVLLRAGIETWSGYGNDAVDSAKGLKAAGVDVVLWPTMVMPPIPPEVASLLTKDPRGPKDVALAFCPPFDLRPWEFADLGRKAVGWTMWERTPMVPEDMEGHGWDVDGRRGEGRWWSGKADADLEVEGWAGHERFDLDLLLVTCGMNLQAMGELDPHVEMDVLACGIDIDRWAYEEPKDGPVRFGWCGTAAPRKDPWLLLETWRDLKERGELQGASLEMKTFGPGLHPAIGEVYPDVTVITDAWSGEQMRAWYASLTAMVSTSRGEGNNKPSMEAMSVGRPSIATDWSGHTNWLHPETGYPVEVDLRPREKPEGTFDARAVRRSLEGRLLEVHADPDRALEKGRQASSQIAATLSWEKVVDRLVRKLEKVVWG